MKYTVFILLALLAAAPAVAQDVYRWVDENGTVHYSDKPRDDAERITVDTPQVYTPTHVPPPRQRASSGVEPDGYTAARITSPENDAVVWGLATEVPVTVTTQPALAVDAGHRIQVLLNGMPAGPPSTDGTAVLSGMAPGPQIVKALVVDRTGAVLIESEFVTIYLRIHSIQNPQRRR